MSTDTSIEIVCICLLYIVGIILCSWLSTRSTAADRRRRREIVDQVIRDPKTRIHYKGEKPYHETNN